MRHFMSAEGKGHAIDEEEVGYYDTLANMGVPYFHWGGTRATDDLMSLCEINGNKKALVVGCGTGYSACYIANKYGCRVVGIDIAPAMVAKAGQRAERMALGDKVEFRLGDAQGLEFGDATFDIVIAEFVTVFLDKERALREYVRVTRPGGYVGVNEIHKSDDLSSTTREVFAEAEEAFEEASGLPIKPLTILGWRGLFEEAGLEDVKIQEIFDKIGWIEYSDAMGGWANTVKLILRVFWIMLSNGRMRRRFLKVNKLKAAYMRNRQTRDYAGAVLCVGCKPA